MKESVNGITKQYSPRFGEIAVDMGLITPEQLKLVLSEQAGDDLSGNPRRLIGSIFFEKGWLTYGEIEEVLKKLFREINKK